MKKHLTAILLIGLISNVALAQKFVPFKYGDMNQWVTRVIPESFIIGGETKKVYEIGPTQTIEGAKSYSNLGGSPWETSNIYARVVGINKTSNAVFPDVRNGSDMCVKMQTIIETCKAIGLINIDVLVGGSIFLGQIFEPITSTKAPYSKMEMGIPFTERPKALRYDYKVFVPEVDERYYISGFSKKKTYEGRDSAEVYIFLQQRWEDADGNIYANRVGTGRERYFQSTDGWVNAHDMEIHYGDITGKPFFKHYMGLRPVEHCYYARNSKGKVVPVKEIGWAAEDAKPTHMLVMASSASGDAYLGTPGITLWLDNIGLVYED